ncbi:CDP-diacylglycerol diphosphatase [Shimwellia blattae]|uniref:CDP-diacylglycerol pyrophosphatase n=1 Tax=Shimwellia blattae (strain ATCC 29907 / DSM 4481 / JCM 1650 / NBRC 105725 / CDC 9005-74) TaxID=630626 RepID=I2BEE8_SHIBC|nr:CDP-diacylglycerol diphosphatase [Shimwellia blattae]AFJ48902.1 CDP-diacylglycerol pyrophosphatase [Shimwellia blattae DSM 4481 = NBRC 105725]GAB81826.1 CDP-diacylglycerol pyrophosphatase [Shimwellia blattae DSM 4481 = NBRC 105725]VDY66386.1 CDP-diacylglycerol pyrophosphatase [Shimwellia blattae]VEC28047.1 CDP-diacylglycerol pyrophosphatase [Shimwellia blattae]
MRAAKWGAGIAIVLGILGSAWLILRPYHPDALWQIVSRQCVPGQQQHQDPAPCHSVSMAENYVTLKDINGPLQYLLMPVAQIRGIESPQLLSLDTANFFWLAWQARGLLSERYGQPIPDSALSLAINSPSGRSQNQLHIHISCLRKDVRQQLDHWAADAGSRWSRAGNLAGHPYLARKVSRETLVEDGPFILLANEIPGARQNMGAWSLALASLGDNSFVLLATERDYLTLNFASAEELQDHDCGILPRPPVRK